MPPEVQTRSTKKRQKIMAWWSYRTLSYTMSLVYAFDKFQSSLFDRNTNCLLQTGRPSTKEVILELNNPLLYNLIAINPLRRRPPPRLRPPRTCCPGRWTPSARIVATAGSSFPTKVAVFVWVFLAAARKRRSGGSGSVECGGGWGEVSPRAPLRLWHVRGRTSV